MLCRLPEFIKYSGIFFVFWGVYVENQAVGPEEKLSPGESKPVSESVYPDEYCQARWDRFRARNNMALTADECESEQAEF